MAEKACHVVASATQVGLIQALGGTTSLTTNLSTSLDMRWLILIIVCIWTSACGVTPQPESNQTVAAFEVPLSTRVERERFLSLLRDVAEDQAMHVDAETSEELERKARVSPKFKMTMNAAVWRGKNDDEPIASVMDQFDHLGRVWITFSRGEDPELSKRFREAAMSQIKKNWPETLSLPIMPTGSIPLHRDLIRTPQGYVVKEAAARKYGFHGEVETPR